jgi:hypothetical protein
MIAFGAKLEDLQLWLALALCWSAITTWAPS